MPTKTPPAEDTKPDSAAPAEPSSSSLSTLVDAFRDAYFQQLEEPLNGWWRGGAALAGSAVFFAGTFLVLFSPLSVILRRTVEPSVPATETSTSAAAIPEGGTNFITADLVNVPVYLLVAGLLMAIYTWVAAGFPTRQGPVRLFLTGLILPALSIYLVRAVWSN